MIWLDLKEILVLFWAPLNAGLQVRRNRNAIEKWLRVNTRDEPGESHVTVTHLSKTLGLSEDVVNKAIATSKVTLRSKKDVNLISIWRLEPQIRYDKHDMRFL